MPVIIPEKLPATRVLKDHGIFVMNELRAKTQDIRPLKICILNLMPDKITTETQLLGKLSNGVLQVDITLLAIKNHKSKNTKQSHLDTFYKHFDEIRHSFFDGIIITGAPIEHLEFSQVSYWNELREILEWTRTNVFTSLFICWGAQAALYHFYGIEKTRFPQKLFGVYPHYKEELTSPLLIGIDDLFYVPHSRNTKSDEEDIRSHPDLKVVASSPAAGLHLVRNQDNRELFMTGHPEYDTDTLLREYLRDVSDPTVKAPINYFKNNNPQEEIVTRWKSAASVFYQNWLNYFVYQETDFLLTADLRRI